MYILSSTFYVYKRSISTKVYATTINIKMNKWNDFFK